MPEDESNPARTQEPLLFAEDRQGDISVPLDSRHSPSPVSPPSARAISPRFRRLPLILFLLTCVSTWFSGMLFFGPEGGLKYAVCVMAILGAHEMGHFLQAKRYGVPASLPLFIPMPISPLGTMGAIIFQQPGVASRRAMYDIAISGPLAGLVLALPILCYGLQTADVLPLQPAGKTLVFSDPLIIELLTHLIHGPLRGGEDLRLNPFLFAGWVGVFITALNLFPLGQLDGGHILYTLLGPPARNIAKAVYLSLIVMMVWAGLTRNSGYFGWSVMLLLVGMTGVAHPPTSNDAEPIGTFRKVLGWITLTFVIWGFIPRPMYEVEPEKPPVQTAPGSTGAPGHSR